jgi:parallel beta-helix repeat protein
VIRGNRFINTFHAVVVHGSIVHVVENDISVPEPERVPSTGHPGVAIPVSATDLNLEAALLCAGNVIAGNRIRGHPDGIAIRLFRAGVSCRDNVIRGNTVAVERVKVPASWEITLTESDSSVVGVPIALINEPKADPEVFGSAEVDEQEGMLEGNLIEGNAILGAEGIGIELFHASGNRIVNNTITRVARRDPFPGITVNSFDPQKSGWREANGSGIWVSPGSEENEILGNTFDDIASHAIVLEGDRNHVELTDSADIVRNLGTGNEITVRAGESRRADHPSQRGTHSGGRSPRRSTRAVGLPLPPQASIMLCVSAVARRPAPRWKTTRSAAGWPSSTRG